jgi:membrane protease YdiL (CAAX protease family)
VVTIIRKWPAAFGVAAVLAISGSLLLAHLLITGLSGPPWIFADSAMRLALTVPCVLLLGYIIQSSGFKFTFPMKGFAKGMFACAGILLFAVTPMLHFFHTSELDTAYIAKIPAVITQQIATGIFEETLFRGLFMTAMLAKWSGTAKGRVLCVLLSGVVFGAGHVWNIFYSGDVRGELMNSLGAGIYGAGWAAAYLYSKNLLSCMLTHALSDIAVHLSNGLIADVFDTTLLRALHIAQPLLVYVVIPLFAIVLSVKAKPFLLPATAAPRSPAPPGTP